MQENEVQVATLSDRAWDLLLANAAQMLLVCGCSSSVAEQACHDAMVDFVKRDFRYPRGDPSVFIGAFFSRVIRDAGPSAFSLGSPIWDPRYDRS